MDAIAGAIQQQEGFYPGSLAWANNNPGNLRYAGQAGATPGAGGFAKFSSYAAGLAALKSQIMLDASRGSDVTGRPTTTLAELIASWAPSSENDTAAYIAAVSASTGYDPNAPLYSLGAGSGISPAAPDLGTSVDSFFADLENGAGSTLDLSAVGLPSSTPAIPAVMAGIVGLALLSRVL